MKSLPSQLVLNQLNSPKGETQNGQQSNESREHVQGGQRLSRRSQFCMERHRAVRGRRPQFNNNIAAIDTAAQKQETPSGATQDKEGARDALEDVLFLMCEALSVLGHNAGDNDLVALTSVSTSALNKLDAEALSNRAAGVLAAANTKKTDLA